MPCGPLEGCDIKQGRHKWFKHLEEVLTSLSFACICANGSIFIWANSNVHVICPVFVDNIMFASKSKAKIAELKSAIAKHFKLHNLGPTTFQLGMQITCKHPAHTMHLLQRHYSQDLLEWFGFASSSPASTPMDPSVNLSAAHTPAMPKDKASMWTVPYVSAVGTLMYLAIAMCLDAAFADSVLCCFMANPSLEHGHACGNRYIMYVCTAWSCP
jgi:hypothetical protein